MCIRDRTAHRFDQDRRCRLQTDADALRALPVARDQHTADAVPWREQSCPALTRRYQVPPRCRNEAPQLERTSGFPPDGDREAPSMPVPPCPALLSVYAPRLASRSAQLEVKTQTCLLYTSDAADDLTRV